MKLLINVKTKRNSKIILLYDRTFKSYLIRNVAHSFSFQTVSTETVENTINALASKSSTGCDNLSTKLLKTITQIILVPLTISINQSLYTGIFPDKLKIAKVIPLYKKDDSHILDNYRPISLLPSISKVFEKIVFKQVSDYFTKKQIVT